MELSEGARRAYLQYDTRQNIAWMSQKKGGRQLRCINDLLSVIERPYLSPGNLELNLEKKCFSFFCALERTISSGLA
jgi:hypothetical protein